MRTQLMLFTLSSSKCFIPFDGYVTEQGISVYYDWFVTWSLTYLSPPFPPVGALPAAHGGQTSDWAPRADLLQDQQRVVSVQRWRSSRQPLSTEQHLLLERRARPLQHGHLYRSHDTGEFPVESFCCFCLIEQFECGCYWKRTQSPLKTSCSLCPDRISGTDINILI